MHKIADESFYVVSGSLEFLNGDRTFVAGAGDFVFVPRAPGTGSATAPASRRTWCPSSPPAGARD
ncbi:cupin domain-containing protein [Streptomyces sp. L7]